jgi:hypothetical protein
MLHWIIDAWLASLALFLELVDCAPLDPEEDDRNAQAPRTDAGGSSVRPWKAKNEHIGHTN